MNQFQRWNQLNKWNVKFMQLQQKRNEVADKIILNQPLPVPIIGRNTAISSGIPEPRPEDDVNFNAPQYFQGMVREAISEENNQEINDMLGHRTIHPALGAKLLQSCNSFKTALQNTMTSDFHKKPDLFPAVVREYNTLSQYYREDTRAINMDKIFRTEFIYNLVNIESMLSRVKAKMQNLADVGVPNDGVPRVDIFGEFKAQEFADKTEVMKQFIDQMIQGKNIDGFSNQTVNSIVNLYPDEGEDEDAVADVVEVAVNNDNLYDSDGGYNEDGDGDEGDRARPRTPHSDDEDEDEEEHDRRHREAHGLEGVEEHKEREPDIPEAKEGAEGDADALKKKRLLGDFTRELRSPSRTEKPTMLFVNEHEHDVMDFTTKVLFLHIEMAKLIADAKRITFKASVLREKTLVILRNYKDLYNNPLFVNKGLFEKNDMSDTLLSFADEIRDSDMNDWVKTTMLEAFDTIFPKYKRVYKLDEYYTARKAPAKKELGAVTPVHMAPLSDEPSDIKTDEAVYHSDEYLAKVNEVVDTYPDPNCRYMLSELYATLADTDKKKRWDVWRLQVPVILNILLPERANFFKMLNVTDKTKKITRELNRGKVPRLIDENTLATALLNHTGPKLGKIPEANLRKKLGL